MQQLYECSVIWLWNSGHFNVPWYSKAHILIIDSAFSSVATGCCLETLHWRVKNSPCNVPQCNSWGPMTFPGGVIMFCSVPMRRTTRYLLSDDLMLWQNISKHSCNMHTPGGGCFTSYRGQYPSLCMHNTLMQYRLHLHTCMNM